MPAPVSVLFWCDNTAPYFEAVKAAGLADRVTIDTLPRKEQPSAEQKARTEVLMAFGAPAGLLPQMPKLRWIQCMMAGVEGWLSLPDFPADLPLTCARGTHEESMPENILGAIFYVSKPYAANIANQKQGKWVATMAQPLNDKTLGILGLGAIGRNTARLAKAIGMRVIGTKRAPSPMEHVDKVVGGDRTAEILAESDFVLNLLPATPETANYMNAERLAQMKPGAWFLNFGRGHTVDDVALVAAVEGKKIAGALLDVFRVEPLPAGHPFWTTENILILPHIGGPHPQRDKFVSKLFVENLARYLDGKPLRALVDREAGY